MEDVIVGGEKRRKWHISYAKFSQVLEVLLDFLRLFGSRNSRITGVWPASPSLALVPPRTFLGMRMTVKLAYSSNLDTTQISIVLLN